MILKGGSMLCPRRRHWLVYAGQWLRGLAYGVSRGVKCPGVQCEHGQCGRSLIKGDRGLIIEGPPLARELVRAAQG